MRVVLDSNVIVSGLNFPGNERLVLDLARRWRFDLYLSLFILEEVDAVLVRKFGWTQERSSQARRVLEETASVVEPRRSRASITSSQADNRILDCAMTASVDYLVTGDRRHLLPLEEHQGVRILNAPRFLSILKGR